MSMNEESYESEHGMTMEAVQQDAWRSEGAGRYEETVLVGIFIVPSTNWHNPRAVYFYSNAMPRTQY